MDAPSDDELVTLRRRVESRPTDLQAHFELGAALCLRGDYVTGMPELQQAMASPTVRFPAMALLADAFDSTGMKEMAARMRQRILEESGGDMRRDCQESVRNSTKISNSAYFDGARDRT